RCKGGCRPRRAPGTRSRVETARPRDPVGYSSRSCRRNPGDHRALSLHDLRRTHQGTVADVDLREACRLGPSTGSYLPFRMIEFPSQAMKNGPCFLSPWRKERGRKHSTETAGGGGAAVVESVTKRETIARLSQSRHVSPPSLELILAMSMIRIPAFELALEKAVEVGVTRIVPFTAARSNLGAGHRHDRWMRIV